MIMESEKHSPDASSAQTPQQMGHELLRLMQEGASAVDEAACLALIDAGALPEDTDSVNKWTPLHYASYWNYPDIAFALIARGANLRARSEMGKTPLMLAADGCSHRIAQALL